MQYVPAATTSRRKPMCQASVSSSDLQSYFHQTQVGCHRAEPMSLAQEGSEPSPTGLKAALPARVDKVRFLPLANRTMLTIDILTIAEQKAFPVRMVAFMICLEVADRIFNGSRLWGYMLRLVTGDAPIALFVQTSFKPVRAAAGLQYRATDVAKVSSTAATVRDTLATFNFDAICPQSTEKKLASSEVIRDVIAALGQLHYIPTVPALLPTLFLCRGQQSLYMRNVKT